MWESLGTKADAQLMQIAPEVISNYVRILRTVVREVNLARREKEKDIVYEEDGMRLQFEILN